jgi:hypothetical protein
MPIIKKDRPPSKNYRPLVLHLEALEEIIKILNELSKEIVIESEDYKCDSISELTEQYKNIYPRSLEITSSNPYCKIELNTRWASLSVGNSSIECSGLFHKLDQVLSATERRPRIFYSDIEYVFFLPILSVTGVFSPLILHKLRPVVHPVLIVIFLIILWLVCCAWILRLTFIKTRKYSTIILEHPEHKQGFFKKHSDQIKFMFVGAVITAVVTWTINFFSPWVIEKLWPG